MLDVGNPERDVVLRTIYRMREADFNRKGVSAFSGRVGQKVASELCTVVDDG